MPHNTPLISTIVVALALAWLFGWLAHRLKVPPLVGYLLAGIAIGPFTPGFVADQALANELSEIGVILLMFGVGLHFSLDDLLSVKAIAIPGAVVQIAFATALGMGFAWWLGWPVGAGIVFGLALSVASTVVLLRAMQERRLIETERGRIAVGWLIVEDLAMVLALVLLPALAPVFKGEGASIAALAWPVVITLGKVAAFVAVMLIVGKRVIPWVLHAMAHTGSRELFRLSVLVIALGAAYWSAELFGVSFALGAFFAGMILSESELSQRAAQETLPLRDAFAVLFFAAVGMLFNPMIVVTAPVLLIVTILIIVIGKSLAAFVIVRLFRHQQFDRADDLGQPGADRRVLVHPREPRRQPRAAAEGGLGPDPRRRDLLDPDQSAAVRRARLVSGESPWPARKLPRSRAACRSRRRNCRITSCWSAMAASAASFPLRSWPRARHFLSSRTIPTSSRS